MIMYLSYTGVDPGAYTDIRYIHNSIFNKRFVKRIMKFGRRSNWGED